MGSRGFQEYRPGQWSIRSGTLSFLSLPHLWTECDLLINLKFRKMKKLSLKYIMLLTTVVLSVAQFSCNKALDLKPLDQISDASFWKTPNDFMLAANQFYTFE